MGRFSKALKRLNEPQKLQSIVPIDLSSPQDLIHDVSKPHNVHDKTIIVDTSQKPKTVDIPIKANSVDASPKHDIDGENLEARVRMHVRILDEIDIAALEGLSDDKLREAIDVVVRDFVKQDKLKLNSNEIKSIASGVIDEMLGLGPLEQLLNDETVSDILINTHQQVYVERGGELELSKVKFADEPHLLRIINRIVSQVGRRVDESQPMADARLLDGSRVNVAIAPIAVDGPLAVSYTHLTLPTNREV